MPNGLLQYRVNNFLNDKCMHESIKIYFGHARYSDWDQKWIVWEFYDFKRKMFAGLCWPIVDFLNLLE